MRRSTAQTPRLNTFRNFIFGLLLLAPELLLADVTYVITGVDETLKSNVLAHVDVVQFGPRARLRPRDHQKVIDKAIADTWAALRPFGYYAPEITARIIQQPGGTGVVEIVIDAGPPVRVGSVDVRITGPGTQERRFRSWRNTWPLPEGSVLNQPAWEAHKQRAIEIANARGYHGAEFAEHALEIDLERNIATLRLVLDTGPRYVMGDVQYSEHGLKPGILDYIPRFETGDPYTAILVSRFRTDLWKTGYFDDVTVLEIERPELDPPAVDFDVRVATENRNRYSGALGWGDDTGIRVQANYSRHPMSSYGDRLNIGIGYQELDELFTMRSRYRKPLRNRARQWWDAELTLRFENLDLEVKRDEEDEDSIKIASGDLTERHIRFGRLKLRNLKGGEAQRFTTPFVQFLNNDRKFDLSENIVGPTAFDDEPDFDRRLRGIENVFSVGYDYEVVDIQGRRFETVGKRDRAWIFHSNKAFGSTIEFTQAYISTRRSYLRGENLKFHVRGEVGYTDATVEEFDLDIAGAELNLSLTQLPDYYRFKAGGSMSVRGYGFERLSNNDVGSNHIITGSAEVEYRFLGSWSGAAFFDIGNAFNDWNDPDLKRGVGVGIRWYSIVGEIRVDVAQALDFDDKPWRFHFTIGTPLL
jgi:translocation and assembly module TamA